MKKRNENYAVGQNVRAYTSCPLTTGLDQIHKVLTSSAAKELYSCT
jgi:hypothetical protein